MHKGEKTNNDNLFIMDKSSIPQELIAVGVEFIKLDKTMSDKEIPPEDIEKIVAAIKDLEDY
ncbi:MAG: hypothetical protein HPY74_11825 [Firmicutes bacterium]|nr:hypothetical protein [Bacillota bacterium]